MNWWEAALAYIVGPAVVGVGTWLAARAAAKGATWAASVSAEVQEDANAIAGFKELVAALQNDMRRLRADHDELEADHQALKADHERMKAERARDKTLIRYLIDYARRLRAELSVRGISVPEPPAGIDIDEPTLE